MTASKIALVSSEIGNLWMTYQEKTMLMRFMEYFLEHIEDQELLRIFTLNYDIAKGSVEQIARFFQEQGAVIPVGFTQDDVYKGVPKLYDFYYDAIFLHMMSKIETNLFALHSTMSYREDVRAFYKELTAHSQEMNAQCGQYLLEKGILTRPPFMSVPKEVTFVSDNDYLSGYHLFGENRSLNAIEVSLIHHGIETNLTGLQLMIGFAQVAKEKQVQQYFVKGMELSKEVEITLGEFLRQDYIEPPASAAGKATNSKIAPFSDKLMMYITSLLSTFGLGSNALGGAFCLRSDLPMTMSRIALKIYNFAKEGGEIMIKNGWMEEPPQLEDRKQLTKS